MSRLHQKKCIPCTIGTPPLSSKQAGDLLTQLDQKWQLTSDSHLKRDFTFNDFMSALDFANQVGIIAEAEGHHPNLFITWGSCQIEIWTHKINGLSESDFVLAAKIDQLSS